jgi:hypothetical protein
MTPKSFSSVELNYVMPCGYVLRICFLAIALLTVVKNIPGLRSFEVPFSILTGVMLMCRSRLNVYMLRAFVKTPTCLVSGAVMQARMATL